MKKTLDPENFNSELHAVLWKKKYFNPMQTVTAYRKIRKCFLNYIMMPKSKLKKKNQKLKSKLW